MVKGNAMRYTEIQDMKRHLNVDFDDDDAYISDLIDVAEEAISTYLNRPLCEFIGQDGCLKPTLKHAVRLLVGNWYANREPVAYASATNVPYTLDYLLLPLKRFVTEEKEGRL